MRSPAAWLALSVLLLPVTAVAAGPATVQIQIGPVKDAAPSTTTVDLEKVTRVHGTMPVLDHISNAEITTLWWWLHAVHRGGSR